MLITRGLIAVAATLVVCLLPLTFPPDGGPSALDRAFAGPVAAGGPSALDRVLVAPSDAPLVLAALIAAVVWLAGRGRVLAAVTMAVTPELALLVDTVLLKPLFDRPLAGYLAYPSGHTVHLVAVVCAFVLLCPVRRAGLVVGVLGAVALVAVAFGQVGMGYHHLTDVLGGAAAAVAITVVCCTAVQIARPGHQRPGGGGGAPAGAPAGGGGGGGGRGFSSPPPGGGPPPPPPSSCLTGMVCSPVTWRRAG